MCEKIDHRTSNDIFNKLINGIKECKWCHQKFENITGSQLANHVRWCKENPNRGKGLKEKLQASKEKEMVEKFGPYKEFEVECFNSKCTNTIIVYEREKKFPEKEHYFCCNTCAHSYAAQQVDPEKIKIGRKLFDLQNPGYRCKDKLSKLKEIRICLWCKNRFEVKQQSVQKCCCIFCSSKNREFSKFIEKLDITKDEYERTKLFLKRYRLACAFTFSIKTFPNEFDFGLIEKHGWYAAKNHGDNLNGISRDHMFSVKDGFINFIDPIFISHPANCRLICHNENVSKLDKSLFDKNELLTRIIDWDQRNGKFNKEMKYEKFNDIFDWKRYFTAKS